ncbi:MAG TPA: MMPL family transporter, partial [Candidatus Dormibacteraeota bacterium]
MFDGLAGLINRVPWGVVIAGVLFASLAGIFGGGVAKSLQSGGFQDLGSQSSQGVDRLETATGQRSDGGVVALVRIGGGVADPASQAEVEKVQAAMTGNPQMASVATYYQAHAPQLLSSDGRSTLVIGYWKKISDQQAVVAETQLTDKLRGDPNVKLGGYAAINQQLNLIITGDLGRAELMAFPILFLLSLWVFRGLIAALLPPLVGGIVVLGAFLFLQGVTGIHPVSIFALNLATGMGLGLAIDYSLFMVSRFREELARGLDSAAAIRVTLRTAGRTVLFSSLTIAAAVGSLTVFPINFLWSMGLAGIIVALTACAVSLTILPAVLRLLGPRVNALSPRRWRRALNAPPASSGFWYRFSWLVMRRPLAIAVGSAVLLIALGLPLLGIRFNSVDQTDLPAGTAARQVSDAMTSDFGAPSGSSMFVVVEAPPLSSSEPEAVQAFASRLSSVAHVTGVFPPQYVGGDTWWIQVQASGGNFDSSTLQVVRDVRSEQAPFTYLVSGAAPQFVDLQASLASHMALAIAIVVAATLVLLFLLT